MLVFFLFLQRRPSDDALNANKGFSSCRIRTVEKSGLLLAVHFEATQEREQLNQVILAPPLNTNTAIYIKSCEAI